MKPSIGSRQLSQLCYNVIESVVVLVFWECVPCRAMLAVVVGCFVGALASETTLPMTGLNPLATVVPTTGAMETGTEGA